MYVCVDVGAGVRVYIFFLVVLCTCGGFFFSTAESLGACVPGLFFVFVFVFSLFFFLFVAARYVGGYAAAAHVSLTSMAPRRWSQI